MYDPISPWFYHFWSSGFVGLLAWLWISSTSTKQLEEDQNGLTNWTFWSQLRLPLLLAVWTHITADVIEHGYPPRIINGMQQLIRFLLDHLLDLLIYMILSFY